MRTARWLVLPLLLVVLSCGVAAYAENLYEAEPPIPEGYDLPYTLAVFLTNQVVVAYDAQTLQPVRHMICSTGAASTPTMRGTFAMPGNSVASWAAFGNVYVRFPTRIKGSYYFHSVLYGSTTTGSLNSLSWRMLGSRASHGCIRMTPIDAQWVAYNCKKGTRVRIVGGDSIHALKEIRDQQRRELNRNGHGAYQPTLKPTPTPLPPTLRLGSSGAAVRALQNKLQQRGFYPGALSGVFDSATESAWTLYQAARGWTADGVATTEAQAAMAEDDTTVAYLCTLTRGFKGPIVLAVEARLKALGFFSGTPNETYDDRGIDAAKKFQLAGGFTPANGVLTPAQQETLFAAVAPTPTPAPDLVQGSRGARVTALQTRLYSLGFLNRAATGRFDASTQAAVTQYQRAIGETESGVVSHALYLRIQTSDEPVGLARTLNLRAKGVVVRVLEEKLRALGFFAYAPDEIYDKKSVAAVQAFESAHGLPVRGIGTPAVIAAILSE